MDCLKWSYIQPPGYIGAPELLSALQLFVEHPNLKLLVLVRPHFRLFAVMRIDIDVSLVVYLILMRTDIPCKCIDLSQHLCKSRSLISALLRERFPPNLEPLDCRLFGLFNEDRVHPNSLGRVLFADFLTGYLAMAEQQFLLQLAQRNSTSSGELHWSKHMKCLGSNFRDLLLQ